MLRRIICSAVVLAACWAAPCRSDVRSRVDDLIPTLSSGDSIHIDTLADFAWRAIPSGEESSDAGRLANHAISLATLDSALSTASHVGMKPRAFACAYGAWIIDANSAIQMGAKLKSMAAALGSLNAALTAGNVDYDALGRANRRTRQSMEEVQAAALSAEILSAVRTVVDTRFKGLLKRTAPSVNPDPASRTQAWLLLGRLSDFNAIRGSDEYRMLAAAARDAEQHQDVRVALRAAAPLWNEPSREAQEDSAPSTGGFSVEYEHEDTAESLGGPEEEHPEMVDSADIRTCRGFFLEFRPFGLGFARTNLEYQDGSTVVQSPLISASGFAIGGAPVTNLSLYGIIDIGVPLAQPDSIVMSVRGHTIADDFFWMCNFVGAGIRYNLPGQFFVGLEGGILRGPELGSDDYYKRARDRGDWYAIETTHSAGSEAPYGIRLDMGKEWWMGSKWTIGVGLSAAWGKYVMEPNSYYRSGSDPTITVEPEARNIVVAVGLRIGRH